MIDTATLKKVRIFSSLAQSELELLANCLKRYECPKGEYILHEGSFGDQIYILVKGTVRVTKDLVKGFDADIASTEKVLATLSADILPTFGENGILGHAARNANVLAATDCVLYTLSKQDFETYAIGNVNAAFGIMQSIAQILSERLNATDENLVKLATALFIAVQG